MTNTDEDDFLDEINEYSEYVEDTFNSSIEFVVENLLILQFQSKLKHWAVTGDGSFAEHEALGVFYADLDPLLDDLVECIQGYEGRILNFSTIAISFEKDMIFQINEVKDIVDGFECEDAGINNILDDIRTLFEKTLYKLKFLS